MVIGNAFLEWDSVGHHVAAADAEYPQPFRVYLGSGEGVIYDGLDLGFRVGSEEQAVKGCASLPRQVP